MEWYMESRPIIGIPTQTLQAIDDRIAEIGEYRGDRERRDRVPATASCEEASARSITASGVGVPTQWATWARTTTSR